MVGLAKHQRRPLDGNALVPATTNTQNSINIELCTKERWWSTQAIGFSTPREV